MARVTTPPRPYRASSGNFELPVEQVSLMLGLSADHAAPDSVTASFIGSHRSCSMVVRLCGCKFS